MKTVIYYFSSTGNTLNIARKISKLLEGDVELRNIAGQGHDSDFVDIDADKVGILFPVYAVGLPAIVRRFVRKLKSKNDVYIFSIASYGGFDGPALYDMARELSSVKLTISKSFKVKQPDNYVPFFKAPEQDKINECFSAEDSLLEIIAQDINTKQTTVVKYNFIKTAFVKLLSSIVSASFAKEDKKFIVSDDCDSCGICSKVCPVNNIVVEDSIPEFKHHCEHCLACLHWCPQKAISYNNKVWQYHHPTVELSDIILK